MKNSHYYITFYFDQHTHRGCYTHNVSAAATSGLISGSYRL